MLKLIVNADDLGLTEKINEGIVYAYKKGILKSSSIVANGAAFNNAINLLKENSFLDIGVHLTLVEEKPLLPLAHVSSLISEDNKFHKNANIFIKNLMLRRINLDEVKKELDCQIQKILDYGIKISHLDSHQHLHVLPQIIKIATGFAEKYKIPFIRYPEEKLKFYMFSKVINLNRIVKMQVLNLFCRIVKKEIVSRTDHFAGFFMGGNLTRQNLKILIENLPAKGTCELMCHPGFQDSKTKYSHWNYHPLDELKAITDPEISEIIKSKKIVLTSYLNL